MGKKSKNETAPMDTPMTPLIDFSDPCLRTFLPVLLQDHTTGKNIIWATEGNAKRALYWLLEFAKMRPDGVWDED